MKHGLNCLTALALFFTGHASAKAEPAKQDGNFDLTADNNLSMTDRHNAKSSFNLGPTGLRGWIYCAWPDKLPRKWTNPYMHWSMLDEQTGYAPWQILVTAVGTKTPADGIMAKDDVILGVSTGAGKAPVPLFTQDARKSFGMAITAAEAVDGVLKIKRWRAGVTSDVSLRLQVLGPYSDTAPYDCPKTARIMDAAAKSLQKQILETGMKGPISALALLSTGNPEYLPMLRDYARKLAPPTLDLEASGGISAWECYKSIFLSEYYMATKDEQVFHGLSEYVIYAATHSSMFGTAGHGFSNVPPPAGWKAGGPHGLMAWYGPVNSAGLVAQISIVLGKKAGVVSPEIDPAIARAANFFGYYVNRGSIPYGEHEPDLGNHGHSSNGKDAMAAVLFANMGDKPVQTEYFTRLSVAAFKGEECGHSGQGFSYLWTTLAANIGGPKAVAEYQKKVLWHRDLTRRCDGSFAYDGAEQFGGSDSVADYWTYTSYQNHDNPTAYYLLHAAIPLKKLCITGKNADQKSWLGPKELSNAVWAGEFSSNSGGYTTPQLIAALGEYDPIVRNYAAQELGVRTDEIPALLPRLIAMADNPTSSNQREGACTALGYMKSADAIPVLVRRLTDKELWVRARAAKALSALGKPVAPHIPDMLAAFVANVAPTYPYEPGFNWSDPLQISNGYLSETLFDKLGADTINADRKLLWPAVRAGIKQPAGMWRNAVSSFVQDRLTLKDVLELAPDLIEDARVEGPADQMFTGFAAKAAMNVLVKYNIQEGIGVCLDKGARGRLASYGEAARWTLPLLYSDNSSVQDPALASIIASIEAATKSPALIQGLPVAIPQIVATPINKAKAVTLAGSSCRTDSVTYEVLTKPLHGTLTGTAPNLTYTPAQNYAGLDGFTFQTRDYLARSSPGKVNMVVGNAGTGLKGVYFDNMDFTSPKTSVINPAIDFDWGAAAPASTMNANTYSVRWTGRVLVPESGAYRFSTRCSDGVRLWVNGTQVINDWTDHAAKFWNDSPPVTLVAGRAYNVKMEYYKNTNPATARLYWYLPSRQDKMIIPQELLYPVSGVSLTSPLDGTRFGLPSAITLTADAADVGTITKVDFYNGNTLIGFSAKPPYSAVWTNVGAGQYMLTARATDNKGVVSTSAAAAVTVDLNTVPVTTGLACYYDAAVGVTTDINGWVTKWEDRSGNAHHAKLGSSVGPAIATNQINGKPVVQFRGKTTVFNVAGMFFAKEQYVVVRSPTTSWSGRGTFLGRRDPQRSSFNLRDGTTSFWYDFVPRAVSMNGTVLPRDQDGKGIFDLGVITNYMILKIDVEDVNPPGANVAYYIGQNYNVGSCDMDIAEIIGYDHVLSTGDEALVGGYLSAKYGIKTTYPVSKVAPANLPPASVPAGRSPTAH